MRKTQGKEERDQGDETNDKTARTVYQSSEERATPVEKKMELAPWGLGWGPWTAVLSRDCPSSLSSFVPSISQVNLPPWPSLMQRACPSMEKKTLENRRKKKSVFSLERE